MRRPPVLLYCQHLLGVGHVRRAAVLARAIVTAGERLLFVQGGPPVPGLDLGGAEAIALPPLVAADDAASRLALPGGGSPDGAYLAARRTRLQDLLIEHDPAVVVLELFPFGRHGLAFELGPLCLALADDRGRRGPAAARVVVSLRDIVVGKANQAWHELAVLAVVERFVDRVLVHGTPDLVPLDRSFGLAERLGTRLVYTGYVAAEPAACWPATRTGEVIISAGGGRVAGRLFECALAAWPLAPAAAAHPWRLVTGPYLPGETRRGLEAQARACGMLGDRPAVVVEHFREDFPALLAGAALSVSQAGYNTALDIVRSGVRAVVVPYEGSGDEQPLRARLLAERGVVISVPASELNPSCLAGAMEAALTTPGFPAPAGLDLDGAPRSAKILAALVDAVAAARATQASGRR